MTMTERYLELDDNVRPPLQKRVIDRTQIKCGNCFFFKGNIIGMCYANPPIITPDGTGTLSSRPHVANGDFCRHFEIKE
jgi:hypothetical protein